MRTRAEEEALRRRAPGLRGLGEATAAHPGIEQVCVMLHVRYSSSFFFACCSAVMVFDKMCRSSIAHLDCSACGFYRSCFGANHRSKDAIPNG